MANRGLRARLMGLSVLMAVLALVLPAARYFPSASALCWWLGGELRQVRIPTVYLSRDLQGLLYLPPCYDEQPSQKYPLLLLFHGQNYTPSQWDILGLDELLDNLIPSGILPPVVAFMPWETSWEPPRETGFDEAVMLDALPWLEAHYRLLPERRYRAIGGISRGGAWAIRLGLTYWTRFGSLGAHSPAVFAGDGLLLPRWLRIIPDGAWPRIYIDVGDADREEILYSARSFEAWLTRLQVPHEWHYNVGRHDNQYWQQHLAMYIRWYTRPWR